MEIFFCCEGFDAILEVLAQISETRFFSFSTEKENMTGFSNYRLWIESGNSIFGSVDKLMTLI